MSDAVITVQDLGKRYVIGHERSKDDGLRHLIDAALRAPFSWACSRRKQKRNRNEEFWALKDVSFSVKQGETVGIIGRNGAGKSTLLKLLSRITEPTTGEIRYKGRVSSLLEVGTGFHPELTGRENIYLNAAILGMRRSDIARKFDEIVAFSEVEKFLDTPVKRYSSGMYVRLAFAVAAHLEPEILIVDEVLAVGDVRFQRKCLGKMNEVAADGRTVVFVSHNLAAVRQLCKRGILLNNGLVACQGMINEVVDTYATTMMDVVDEAVFLESKEKAASITRLCLRNTEGQKQSRFSHAEEIILEVEYSVHKTLVYDHVFVLLYRADGLLLSKASDDDDPSRRVEVVREPGRYLMRVRFPGGILNEGFYQFRVVIGKRRGIEHDAKTGSQFKVDDTTDYSNSSFGKRDGVLLVPLTWNERKTNPCQYSPMIT